MTDNASAGTQTGGSLNSVDITRVMQMIPHRFPMLLVDRVVEINGDESGVGIKNVTINEPFFQGHFPSQPVMPGVLIIESMAQTAGVLVVYAMGKEAEGKLVYFMAVDDARFRRPVVPGDQLRIEVRKERSRGAVWRYAAKATVDGQLVAEAVVTAMIRGV